MLDWLAGEATRLSPWDALLRLSVAIVLGGLIGFDREMRRKPAGLRLNKQHQPNQHPSAPEAKEPQTKTAARAEWGRHRHGLFQHYLYQF